MGAGASTTTTTTTTGSAAPPLPRGGAPPAPKPLTRKDAIFSSYALLSTMVTGGFTCHGTQIGKNIRQQGVVHGDVSGFYVSKTRNAEPFAAVPWTEAGLHFAHAGDKLLVTSDSQKWVCELKNETVASWLATYLHAYLPETFQPREYTVTFEEWGALGIRFAMFNSIVIPVVFTCEGAAAGLGVKQASILSAVNGIQVDDLDEDVDMLTYVSDAAWPKVCTFTRPASILENLRAKPAR